MGNVLVRAAGPVHGGRLGFQCAAGVDDGYRDCADRRHFTFISLVTDRSGAARPGESGGLGCAADFDFDPDVSLHRVHFLQA